MKDKPPLPVRKRIRLSNFDYSQDGYYFVTVCSENKENIFGDIKDCKSNHVRLSLYGQIIKKHICRISSHYQRVRVDKYVIMPNHIHLIVVIGCDGKQSVGKQPTLANIIGSLKAGVTKEIGKTVWQTRFHDHVIRNEKSYLKIWNYIDTNPLQWEKDIFYW